MNLLYIWNKVLKKLRGVAILNSEIHGTSKVEAGCHIVNSSMGRYSYCGYDCEIINCSIGFFCSIAGGVIIGGAQHPVNWVSTSPVFYFGRDSVKKKFSEFKRPKESRTIIGNDVWIGARAILKAGVEIGDGAVIGMGSVVTKNVGEYEVWGGNPAHLIKKRFSDELIEKLIESKWWERSNEELLNMAQFIRSPEEFVKAI